LRGKARRPQGLKTLFESLLERTMTAKKKLSANTRSNKELSVNTGMGQRSKEDYEKLDNVRHHPDHRGPDSVSHHPGHQRPDSVKKQSYQSNIAGHQPSHRSQNTPPV
jgi:hypothetical protein